MTYEIILVFAVLVLAVVLFVTEKLRVDLVALLVMALLLLSGIVTPTQGLAGFSNAATITVGAMFVLSAGLLRTGAVNFLADFVTRVFRRGFWIGILSVMVVVGTLSAFVNNTPVVAIFLPILLGVARETGFSASKLLMPLSFAAIFGGVCTLIGTSTNILISSMAQDQGVRPLTMFEFAPLGVIFLIVGTIYMLAIGIRLIPDRRGSGDFVEDFGLGEYLAEVVLTANAKSAGYKIKDAPIVKEMDMSILKIQRGDISIQLPRPEEVLQIGDELLVKCDVANIRAIFDREGVEMKSHAKWGDAAVASDAFRLVEAVVEPNSDLIGSTLKESGFRERYGATVLAIRKRGTVLHEKVSETRLASGDVLLVEIEQTRIPSFRRGGEFIITSEIAVAEFRRNKAIFAVMVVAGVIIAASINIVPIVVAAVFGAVVILLTGCLSIEEAYEAIEWKIIFLLAGVLSLGIALDESGAAAIISTQMVSQVGSFGPMALVSAFYILTSILTALMSNNATAALLVPIAITTAQTLDVDPVPFLMAIAFATSADFMTPIGYQTNTMIYGPGQYKFVDFVTVGTPLNVMFWLIATVMIPIIWPL